SVGFRGHLAGRAWWDYTDILRFRGCAAPETNEPRFAGDICMVDTMLIDLKALMVEREDCDAGTVEKLKNGLAQGKTQYRTLREATDQLRKKVEASTGAQ